MSNQSIASRSIATPALSRLSALIVQSFRTHAVILLIIGIYCTCVLVIGHISYAPERVNLDLYNWTFFSVNLSFASLYLCGRALYIMVKRRPEMLFQAIWNDFKDVVTLERLLSAIPILVGLPIFFSAFNSAKSLIPVIKPFSYDPTFIRCDELIFGTQPWRLLWPLLRHPVATYAMDGVYNMWYLVMAIVVFWQTFSLRDAKLRQQFFLSYFLAWVLLGSVMATWLSSAGPCFCEKLGYETQHFRQLFDHLQSVSVRYKLAALTAQDYLWKLHQQGSTGIACGISAMPSMHVAMVVCFTLVGWQIHPTIGLVLGLFALLSAISCVYLGWHYAVDVFVAAGGMLAIWWLVGLFLRRVTPGHGQ